MKEADSMMGNALVKELLANPKEFNENGDSLQLLECFFHGLSLDILRDFFAHDNLYVKRMGAWIASELSGKDATLIANDILPLLDSSDWHTKAYTLDVIMVTSAPTGNNFYLIVPYIYSKDLGISRKAMWFVSKANNAQLKNALKAYPANKEWLNMLINISKTNTISLFDILKRTKNRNEKKRIVVALKRVLNKSQKKDSLMDAILKSKNRDAIYLAFSYS